ncbi:hypothetical protein TFLX_05412 [Thermoflexales bacterium]|nr:hypothetical protein TFLX_05412 [Thermoflexales bacterium]
MNRRTSVDLHRYDSLWNLAKILRYIGWGVMLLGAGAAVLSLIITVQAISAFGAFRGSAALLLPALLSAGLMVGSAIAVGVSFLAFSELLKAIIDIAFFSMHTSQTVTGLAEAERSPTDISGLKEELAQMTAVLREVNTNTQKTAALLEQLAKPRTAAK